MKKSLLFFSGVVLFSILFQPACTPLKPIEQSADVLFSKSEISNSLDKYDVYVHGSNGVLQLKNAHVSGDTLFEKNNSTPIAKDPSHRRESITIYSNGPIHPTYKSAREKIILTKKQIRNIISSATLHSRETPKDGGGDGDLGIALGLLILLVILGILIIWLIIYLIIQSTNAAAQGSSNGSGSNSNGGGSSSGCYIATMVYGDYDAPQVMTLRKFRDETLSRSAGGRAFIRWYYSWSPGFVKKYNHLHWLHKIIRVMLDGLVKLLS